MSGSEMAANLIAVMHAAFAVFILAVPLAILGGKIFGWRWMQNEMLSGSHLIALAILNLRMVLVTHCPLTLWEDSVRRGSVSGSLGQVLHVIAFRAAPEDTFVRCVQLLTLASFALYAEMRLRREFDSTAGQCEDLIVP